MSYNYWNLKFPDKTTADSLLFSSDLPLYDNIDVIGIIYDGVTPVAGWHVNLATTGSVPVPLQSYVIPFPLFPKRVWFTNSEGVM